MKNATATETATRFKSDDFVTDKRMVGVLDSSASAVSSAFDVVCFSFRLIWICCFPLPLPIPFPFPSLFDFSAASVCRSWPALTMLPSLPKPPSNPLKPAFNKISACS